MKTYEIFFNDLTERAQKELMEFVGVDDPKELNWDVFPIAELDMEDIENG